MQLHIGSKDAGALAAAKSLASAPDASPRLRALLAVQQVRSGILEDRAAAEEELRTGSGLEDTALSGRVEHIGTEVSEMLPGTDPADIKECALEFYREEV